MGLDFLSLVFFESTGLNPQVYWGPDATKSMQIPEKGARRTRSPVRKTEKDAETSDPAEPQLLDSSGSALPSTQKPSARSKVNPNHPRDITHEKQRSTKQHNVDSVTEAAGNAGSQQRTSEIPQDDDGHTNDTKATPPTSGGSNEGNVHGASAPKADRSDAQDSTSKESSKLNQNEKYGLHGLAEIVRMSNKDANMFALGCDFAGQNMDPTKCSSWKLFSPFVDVQPQPSIYELGDDLDIPPVPKRGITSTIKQMSLCSNETLFYVFYTLTRDIFQEAAAQELYNRSWRFHKELKLWLSRDASSKSVKGVGFERSNFVFFDPGIWSYVKKEWVLYYSQLEERGPLST